MTDNTELNLLLIEFDSIKGPIIRKKSPDDFELPANYNDHSLLMWVIRSTEFSVRKIKQHTAYAKIISLKDPNFMRKKRQFGLALITPTTIELEKAESLINKIISKCQKDCENKPYFKMLLGLIQIIDNFPKMINNNGNNDATPQIIQQQDISEGKIDDLRHFIKNPSNNQFILISNRLNVFNKLIFNNKKDNLKVIVSHAKKIDKVKETIGTKIEFGIDSYEIIADVKNEVISDIKLGLELLLRILDSTSLTMDFNKRILVAAEFLDRLLTENVDIEYYLPFLQYLISMEQYSVSEFKTEDYETHLSDLMDTHGEWIQCLKGKELDGKPLKSFFEITDIKREGLELLIDLLFVKLIAIF
ncbi:MAG: hypothetical protein FK734_13775 [Asgard group archaeon]|nr:hypothetical protein [Asgard group archaeon]